MGRKHVDEFTGMYIKYMTIFIHISACQRAPIVAEAVNRMAVPSGGQPASVLCHYKLSQSTLNRVEAWGQRQRQSSAACSPKDRV